MREIRNPGVRCLIRINKEAFLNFLKERGTSCTKLSNDLGYSRCYITSSICKLHHTFSVGLIDKIAEFFSVRPQDMEFIDDEAHTLLYKLGIPFDGPTQKGNKIARIREYLAQGLDRDKIFELMYTPPIKKENDPKIKSIPMAVPKATLTHSEVSEAFDEVANSEKKTLGNDISECTEELSENTDAQIPTDPIDMYDSPFAKVVDETEAYHTSVRDAEKRLRLRELLLNSDPHIKNQFIMNVGRISNMEKYLRDRERTAAQTLAKSLITHIKHMSTLRQCDEATRYARLTDARNREQRMQKEFWIWKASQGICKDLRIRENGSLIKERPWLELTWFFMSNTLLKDQWEARGKLLINQLKLENFSGRYSIEEEEETNHEGN